MIMHQRRLSAPAAFAPPEPRTTLTSEPRCKVKSQLSAGRREGRCDVVVRVGRREFPAHRNVLAAGSDTLAALLDGDRFADSVSPIIDLKEVSASSFEAVLAYLYDGTCDCARSKLLDVGATAAFLQVGPLLELVASAIGSDLGANNCVTSWVFATKFSLADLADRCRETVMLNFTELGDTLHALPPTQMRSLLNADMLPIRNEKEVLDAALAYARSCRLQDDSTLADFFSGIRFTQLSANTMDYVMREPLFAGIACQKMLLRAFVAHRHGRPEMPRGRSAERVKGMGKSAEQAKAMGVDARQIFALCKKVYQGNTNLEGKRVILYDGKCGTMYAKDRDDASPWWVIVDGTDAPTGAYHKSSEHCYLRMRLLKWA